MVMAGAILMIAALIVTDLPQNTQKKIQGHAKSRWVKELVEAV